MSSCLLVVLSCRLCMVLSCLLVMIIMFRAYPVKKSWTGLWTLDPGVGTSPSCAHPVFNQSLGGSFSSYAISVAFARWNFLLHATKKNNNVAKFFVSLKQNNSEGFIGDFAEKCVLNVLEWFSGHCPAIKS